MFFVHFEKMEFSADVFQVPAAVGIPAKTSIESLTRAAAAVSAWYTGADDRALWECIRVIVPEIEIREGRPLDADAEKIVWSDVNEVGLRLGLGGLEPGVAFPIGQPLPLKHYLRNDGGETLTLSPTQVFNEGISGELIRVGDGKRIPHQKGYRWQISSDRARLAPGQYIDLQPARARSEWR